MAREDVNIKVSANVAEAIQMWKAMEEGPESMAKSLEGMGRRGKASTKSLGDEIVGMVGKWATVGAAVAAVTSLIQEQVRAVQKLREERVASTNTTDDLFNRFQVQSGLTSGAQANQVRQQLFSIAAQRKTSIDTALPAATQLVSSGATVEEVTGGGLDAFLQLLTATNATGKNADPVELAKAMVMYLGARGQRPTGANITTASVGVQRLFAGTNLQVANLARFSREARTIKEMSGLGGPEDLAIYSQFIDAMGEDVGATTFRSGVVSLATAGATGEKVRALKMLGLKPGDVDFQGESFGDVQRRLTGAFGRLPGAEANIAAKLLFGQEALGFYNTLLNPQGLSETNRRVGLTGDRAGYESARGIGESGRGAEARQAEALAASAMFDENAMDPEVIRNRLTFLARQQGFSDEFTGLLRSTLESDSDLFGMIDVPVEERVRRTSNMIGRFSGRYGDRLDADTAREYLTGQRELRIRVMGADGRDIPTEVEAEQLNGSQ